ncbi:MAG TPA: hypothetical protein VGD30_18500 [Telluria sp.]
MSIQTLELELEGRSGRELFPNFFPLDLLIALTRELALFVDGSLSYDELTQVRKMLQSYLRRIFEMQGNEQLDDFDGRTAELMPPLVEALYDFMREEMVSKLIGYDIRKTSMRDRFLAVLAEENESL